MVKSKLWDHQKQSIQKGKNPEKPYFAEAPSIFKKWVPTSSVIKIISKTYDVTEKSQLIAWRIEYCHIHYKKANIQSISKFSPTDVNNVIYVEVIYNNGKFTNMVKSAIYTGDRKTV